VYLAYDLTRSMVQPLAIWAGAVRATFSATPLARLPLAGPVAAGAELLESATRRYPKPSFDLVETLVDGSPVAVREVVVADTPFCKLRRFERVGVVRDDPRVLLVAPLSGHHATLLRETVEALLPDHDVFITDWVDARLVPRAEGRFGLEEYVDLVRRFLCDLGPAAHVVAVCQPCVPVLAAVAVMAAESDPMQPATMSLISGPVDPRVSPTRVNEFARDHSIGWIETTLVYRVPPPAPGFGRRVYPGALQLNAFVSLGVSRHVEAHLKHFVHVATRDDEAAEKHRKFYDEYFAVLDLPAEFYLETVSQVFQEHRLPRGVMLHRGVRVQPEAIEGTALLTVEGDKDDITGLGQTEAAHSLCRALPAGKRRHYVQAGAGHYGTFSGRRWREEIAPVVRDFIREHRR
jgi:poly(3-hydroxybutyrate) depolymerase